MAPPTCWVWSKIKSALKRNQFANQCSRAGLKDSLSLKSIGCPVHYYQGGGRIAFERRQKNENFGKLRETAEIAGKLWTSIPPLPACSTREVPIGVQKGSNSIALCIYYSYGNYKILRIVYSHCLPTPWGGVTFHSGKKNKSISLKRAKPKMTPYNFFGAMYFFLFPAPSAPPTFPFLDDPIPKGGGSPTKNKTSRPL